MAAEFAEDDRPYPKAIKCRGGWFAVQTQGELGSGPWRNQAAAEAALRHDYDAAHKVEKDQ